MCVVIEIVAETASREELQHMLKLQHKEIVKLQNEKRDFTAIISKTHDRVAELENILSELIRASVNVDYAITPNARRIDGAKLIRTRNHARSILSHSNKNEHV